MAAITDDHVVLLERTLQKNREVIIENQRLREDIRANEAEHNKVLREVLAELKAMREKQDNGGNVRPQLKRKQSKIQVPSTCRRTLRKVFKTLSTKEDFPGFYLQESVDSANNATILQRVRWEIYHYVGGQDKCQWSDAQIEEAFRRYFLTSVETDQKKKSGTYEEHKRKCRRQGRKREKITRRTVALDKATKWSDGARGRMAELLTEGYMSSEESDMEGDTLVYVVRTIPWESDQLKKRKAKLDKIYTKGQSKRSQQRAVKRVRKEGVLSSLPRPADCPGWACVSL